MKNIFIKIIVSILLIVCVFSCSKTDYLEYDTTQKDGVFFNFTANNDSMFYNFGFYDITEQIIKIPVYLMGMPKDYERTFKVFATNEKYATEEVPAATDDYFEIPSTITMDADSTVAWIPIKLIRHPDLEEKRVVITINIGSSDELDIKGYSEFTISFDDKTPAKPRWWSTYSMGSFTKFKGQLFFKYFWEMEQEQKPIFDAIVDRWGEFLDIYPNYYSNSPLVVYRIAFKKYVILKMYNYSLEHPELNLNIKEPTF